MTPFDELKRYLRTELPAASIPEMIRAGINYTAERHDPPLPDADVGAAARHLAAERIAAMDLDAPPPTEEDFAALLTTHGPIGPLDPVGGLPTIQLNRPRSEIDPEARKAFVAWCQARTRAMTLQEHPRPIWVRESKLLTIAPSERTKALSLHEATVGQVFDALLHAANWVSVEWNGDHQMIKAKDPGILIARSIADTPPIGVPPLTSVAPAPVFGSGGRYLDALGYHADDGVWRCGLADLGVPSSPTIDDVDAAIAEINELIDEFPFESDADRATILALIFLPHVRCMIDGPVPLHMVCAPINGVGKTMLAGLSPLIYYGAPQAPQVPSKNEDEVRKMLTATAIAGDLFLFIDNLKTGSTVDSPSLAMALTTTMWRDRVLQVSERVEVPVHWIPIATGVGTRMSTELSRRTVICKLRSVTEQPWTRSGFRIDDLYGHCIEHRPRLLRAIHTVIASWIECGQEQGTVTLGSYVSWARVIGGIMAHAGVKDFLGNLQRFYAEQDGESEAWWSIVQTWAESHGSFRVTPTDLVEALEHAKLSDEIFTTKSARAHPAGWLSRQLHARAGKVIAGYRIVKEHTGHARRACFKLVKVDENGEEVENEPTRATQAKEA